MIRSSLLPIALACVLSSATGGEPKSKGSPASAPGKTLIGTEAYTAIQAHDTQISSLTFTPDGKTLISAGNYGPIFLWDTAQRKRTGTLAGTGRVLALSANGQRLATAAINSSQVRIWDLSTAKETLVITVPDATELPLGWFPSDGRKLFTLDWNQKRARPFAVRHWDLATSKQERLWTIPNHIYPLAIVADGTLLATLDYRRAGIYDVIIYDVISDRVRSRRILDDGSVGIFDPNWDQIRWRRGPAQKLALFPTPSPDAKLLASGMGSYAGLWLWELVTGKEIHFLKGHQASATTVAWSPDGCILASGDQRAKLQDPFGTQSRAAVEHDHRRGADVLRRPQGRCHGFDLCPQRRLSGGGTARRQHRFLAC